MKDVGFVVNEAAKAMTAKIADDGTAFALGIVLDGGVRWHFGVRFLLLYIQRFSLWHLNNNCPRQWGVTVCANASQFLDKQDTTEKIGLHVEPIETAVASRFEFAGRTLNRAQLNAPAIRLIISA